MVKVKVKKVTYYILLSPTLEMNKRKFMTSAVTKVFFSHNLLRAQHESLFGQWLNLPFRDSRKRPRYFMDQLIAIYYILLEAEHKYLISIEINTTRLKRCKVAS
jgi:hypothetical protein